MKKIIDVLTSLKISPDAYEFYGNDIVKIKAQNFNNQPTVGKLILMTSINPTAAGEGKTTTAIGLTDGLNYLNHQAILALREPSLGPVFGRKGTATGGGESVVLPEDKINLHFTGDLHAISTANNLISAAIDNEIYWKSSLDIDPDQVVWKRTIDLNDRSLRTVEVKISKQISRVDEFSITAASNMMTILTLATSMADLKHRLDNALVAYSWTNEPIFIKDLEVTGSVLAILNEAIKPNFVLTKYGSPALVHCGPFANISIGTNSLISTNLGRKIAAYTIVESGFGSDLGFEKFMNLVNLQAELVPACVVMVVTIRALKLHDDFVNNFKHLKQHLDHVSLYNLNMVVAINLINGDSQADLKQLQTWLDEHNYTWAINEAYTKGPQGAEKLANAVVQAANQPKVFQPLLQVTDPLEEKIKKIVTNFYYLTEVHYSKIALEKLAALKNSKYKNLPVCLVKSQNSIDGNDNQSPHYRMEIKDLSLNTGGQFILVYTNQVFSMPGLNKDPNYKEISVADNQIVGLK